MILTFLLNFLFIYLKKILITLLILIIIEQINYDHIKYSVCMHKMSHF